MSINLLFTGDFAPCRRFEELLLSKGASIFGGLQSDILSADLAFVNLEAPLCNEGVSIEKSGPSLHAHPDCINAVKEAGFNVIGLANNHIMDYGHNGLSQTLQACEQAELPFCGAGSNLVEAQEPLILERKGIKVAYIAVAEHEFSIAAHDMPGAAPLDPIDNLLQIVEARQQAELVFVSIHGGNEYFPYPRPGLRKICRFLIAKGADGVICHHPHVPGAYEFFEGKPIIYSLGNLIFDHHQPPTSWGEGYALRLEYDLQHKTLKSHEFIPYTQSVLQGGIKKMHGDEIMQFYKRLEKYEQALTSSDIYSNLWDEFCASKATAVLLRQYFPLRFRGMRRIADFLSLHRLILPKSMLLGRLNMVRCESHRELLLKILEKQC